jgi:monothiol glutaredoxin
MRSSSRPPPNEGVKTMTDAAQARIAELVQRSDVLLFMKGSPLFPQCGFSSRAVAILQHLGVEFDSVDVLQDQEVRQGIKAFSDWPTIPQLYVKGEFVGGSDIMMEMYESGELAQLLTEQGATPAA